MQKAHTQDLEMLIFIAIWTFVQLHEQTKDKQVVRYVYYFLARLLVESGA